MSDDPIVSHVASPEYREHIDEMTCAASGCKRWRTDDRTLFCTDHEPVKTTIERINHEGAIRYGRIGKCKDAECGLFRADEASGLCSYHAKGLAKRTPEEGAP